MRMLSVSWLVKKNILESGAINVNLRTPRVFSVHSNNFVKIMLYLVKIRNTLSIIADQIGGPTPARYIASACLIFVQYLQEYHSKSETYHLTGVSNVSWTDFASDIFARASRSVTTISSTTAEHSTVAKRPRNSRMDCSLPKNIIGIEQLD